nr:putative reverse transcriptase domain-containing protein [Tanacetum cinerariifolium]
MAEPLFPNHVFDFSANDPILDLEDPILKVEEDPKEEPEEVIPLAVASPPGSPAIIPSPLSDSDSTAPVVANRTVVRRHIDAFNVDFGFIKRNATRTSDDVLALQEGRARDQDKMKKLERRVDALEVSNTFMAMDREMMEREFLACVFGCLRAVERLVANRVAEAIAEYKRNRTNPKGAGGSGGNAGGDTTLEVHGCSYKTFLNCKPHSFNATEGVVGLSRWFEKMESVFKICKCAEEDKLINRFEPKQQESLKATREGGKTIKETTTTTTSTSTTSSKTKGRKLLKLMWLPQLREEVIKGTYRYAMNVICITMLSALLSAETSEN